ncbi:MAG: ABC transporter permease [Rectinemataceae bacterium]|jgi:lipopolysaccharide transport system permease protein
MIIEKKIDGDWDLIITPKDKVLGLDLKELFQYKDLLGLLIRRDFVSVYKQTILGPIWFVFQPLMSTIMYMFVFGSIAKMGTDGIPQPLFYFAGTMLWAFFSGTFLKCQDTFINNAGLFGKVYFPRFTMPIAYTVNSFFTFMIQFTFMIIFYVFYLVTGTSVRPTIWILFTPVLIVQLALLGMGIGILISALTTKYRDLRQLVSFAIGLLMYMTPVVYPLSKIPEKWKIFFFVNPLTPIFEMFRFAFLGSGTHDLAIWGVSMVATLLLFWLGVVTFNHNEKTFVDVI